MKIDSVNSSPVGDKMLFSRAHKTYSLITMLRYRISKVATLVTVVVSRAHFACSLVLPVQARAPHFRPVSAGPSAKEIWIHDEGPPLKKNI